MSLGHRVFVSTNLIFTNKNKNFTLNHSDDSRLAFQCIFE